MRYQGRISEWRDEQGFGFITPNGGGERVFLHIKAFTDRGRRPGEGDLVNYVVTQDERGRPRAESAERVRLGKKRPRAARALNMPLLCFAGIFLVFVGILVAMDKVPLLVAGWYAGLSILTFAIYAKDKSAAVDGDQRTPEKTLQTLALLGGWPGGLIAQQLLRHKSSKRSFLAVFWFSVIANLVAFGWLFSKAGKAFLAGLPMS